jgi:hypothetical protein
LRIEGERRLQAKQVIRKAELVVVNEKATSNEEEKEVKCLDIA